MKIKWLGHASFLITTGDGKKIVTDPYHPAPDMQYAPIKESADIVTKSHNHGDHNNTGAISGSPAILETAGTQTIKEIKFKVIQAFHDAAGGSQRGTDLIFCFHSDGLKLCHLGDLGQPLSPQQKADIGPVDILMIPVGGFYTISVAEATETVQLLNPRLVFPMHYKTDKNFYPIAKVDEFLKDKKNIRKIDGSEYEVSLETLPAVTEIIVLNPAN